MAAKAAVRLRRIRMDKSPESVVFRRSLVILSWAVSALRWGRKPNWSHITAADLRGDETEPEVREGWIMAVMRDDRRGRRAGMRHVGRGSG